MKKDKTMSQFTFILVKQLLRFLAFFFVGYRHKDKYKIKKDEPVLVLSNHQTDIDSLLVNLSFNRLLCAVATDNLFKKDFFGWLLHKFGGIPKKKGSADLNATLLMLKAIRGNKSVVLFPEGNRAYAEFQYYITPDISRLVKAMKPTLVLFNLHGGTGTRPRFMRKRRLGKFYGQIKLVLKYEEYKDIPDDELYDLIVNNLKVVDAESGELYKSPIRGEYLERMFFVCPSCQKVQSLYSKKEFITCHNCGFEAEFTEDLRLQTNNESINFTKLVDWYNYQIKWCNNFTNPDNKPIFWTELLEQRYELKALYNEAKSGSTVSYSVSLDRQGVSNISTVFVVNKKEVKEHLQESNYAIIFAGANDYLRVVTRGNIDDVNDSNYYEKESFRGAYNYLIKKIKEINPKIKVICMSTIPSTWAKGASNYTNPNPADTYNDRATLNNDIHDIATLNQALYIYMYDVWNEGSDVLNYSPDGIHPNSLGYEKIIEKMFEK